MNKLILIILLFIAFIPITQAISLGLPEQREIIFEPNKNISLSYSVGNSDPRPMTVEVRVSAGELQQYLTEPEKTLTVPAQGAQYFGVTLKLPSKLKSGLYPLTVSVSEKAETGGMAAVTGATDIINIISPYEEGFPYGTLSVNQYQSGGPIIFSILVQNIGNKTLGKIEPQATLSKNGQINQSVFTNSIPVLSPFKKGELRGTFDATGLSAGQYEISLNLGKTTLTKTITYGEPKISVLDIFELKAGQQNNFTMKIKLENWVTPLQGALIKIQIKDLIKVEKTVTLMPGENNIQFSAIAKPGRTGTYSGRLNIYHALVRPLTTFNVQVKGSAGFGGIGFGKTADTEEELPQEELPALQKVIKQKSGNEIFLILLLVASFVIFAFALGNYFAKRKKPEVQNEIPTPQPPK